jgi:predicted amidohydrolase YtcJ
MTLLRRVEVEGAVFDVRVGASVEAIGQLSALPGEDVIEGQGGALIPGLHDHHLHLLALAAAASSVDVSTGLEVLRGREGGGWLRAVGWDQDGDRRDLDAVVPDRPVRVQHRSGALWVVNSRGLRALDLDASPGIERDAEGEPTGRLWRMDAWLADQVGRELPDLAAVGDRLLRLGITGVTDATPDLDPDTCALLRASVALRLLLLGDREGTGPYKVVLPDHDLPSYDELLLALSAVRPRPVAVHCVTREALLLLLVALDEVGHHPGDRIEHGSLVPSELTGLRPIVVTQPAFLTVRGDDYLRSVDAVDLPDLYRYGSLRAAGTCVVPSSDAPFGPLDPWVVLRAARDRTSLSGARLGAEEAVSTAIALDGMLRPLENPRAPARAVRVGAPADLVLLDAELDDVLNDPDARRVRATLLHGRVVGR